MALPFGRAIGGAFLPANTYPEERGASYSLSRASGASSAEQPPPPSLPPSVLLHPHEQRAFHGGGLRVVAPSAPAPLLLLLLLLLLPLPRRAWLVDKVRVVGAPRLGSTSNSRAIRPRGIQDRVLAEISQGLSSIEGIRLGGKVNENYRGFVSYPVYIVCAMGEICSCEREN